MCPRAPARLCSPRRTASSAASKPPAHPRKIGRTSDAASAIAGLDSTMITIEVSAETSVDPATVIEAPRDFSERRPTIWPNVKAGHFEVHASGATFVEATEYLWPLGFYERCRYEWPESDHVRATVLDSNTLAPG